MLLVQVVLLVVVLEAMLLEQVVGLEMVVDAMLLIGMVLANEISTVVLLLDFLKLLLEVLNIFLLVNISVIAVQIAVPMTAELLVVFVWCFLSLYY